MKTSDWKEIFSVLEASLAEAAAPSVTRIAETTGNDPYKVLLSTLISLRTKDEVTLDASERLFAAAAVPQEIALLAEEEIAGLIYPAGFYRVKARSIKKITEILLARYDGKVPRREEELLELPGVGRKTANLVLNLGYGIPAICVDTHVHRISNRLGWVETKNPEETEKALASILPREYWIPINGLLVAFGQRICTPQSPRCASCRLSDRCGKIGVTRFR